MKLRLPLLLRLALLSTAAAYTLGSGCLFADDAPADAVQDDPIAEAVDEEESDSPAIGFEGYTESQLVDIQSSDSAGAVIRQMLENSTTGAVANVGTSSSTSNGATTAAESPALTLSAPAEPVTDTTLTTSTLSDSAGEGAVAPFFSAEEAAALVVASPATSTPSLKNTSTATLSSSDSPDETTSSVVANGAVSSSLSSVGSASAGASSGGGSASYTLTSSAPDSSSSSLVITTPTDDSSSDPIAEDVLEDSTTEDTTTSTLPDSSTSTLAGTSSTSATTRTLPVLKLLGSTSETSTQGIVKVDEQTLSAGSKSKGVEFVWGQMASGPAVNILYLGNNDPSPKSVEVAADSFYVCPAGDNTMFNIETLVVSNKDSCVNVQNNPWVGYNNGAYSLDLTVKQLSVNGSASLDVSKTQTGAISVSIGKVENSSTESTTGPLLTSVTNSGTLTLGTNANLSENVDASSVSIGALTNKANGTMTLNGTTTVTGTMSNTGTMTLNGTTATGAISNTGTMTQNGAMTITGLFSNEGKLTNNGTLTLGSGSSLNLDQFNLSYATDSVTENGVHTVKKGYLIAWGNGNIINEGATVFQGETELSAVTASGNYLIRSDAESESCYVVAVNASYSNVLQESSALATVVVKKGVTLSGVESLSTQNICGDGTVQIAGNILYENEEKLDGVFGTIEVGSDGILDFGGALSGLSYADNVKILSGGKLTASGADFSRSFELAGGELTSSGNETYSGTITISSASTVSSSKNGTTTLSGTLTGDSKLTISGDGTVQLFGDVSNFSGPISVESGTLQFKVGTKAGQNGSTVSVAEGATLDINGFADTCFTVELKGGTLKNGGGECSEDSRQINRISLTENSILQADKKFGLVGSGYGDTTIDLAGKTLTKNGEGKFFANNVALTGGGTLKIAQGEFELRQSGGSQLSTLGDINSSTNIWLLNGTTLSGGFTMNHSAEFKLNDGDTSALGTATISATITNVSKTATFEVASGDTLTFSGNMVGDGTTQGNLTKTEAGKLLLSGNNNKLAKITVSGGITEITGSTTVTTAGSGIHLNSGSVESPVGLDISGSGCLTYDSVTYQALSGQTAEIRRMGTEEGNFSLSNSSYSISSAALEIGGTSTQVKVHTKLDGVTLSSTRIVQLGCSEASLSGISVSELHVGYWDDNINTKSNVTAILTGEGQVSGEMKVIMTSALTVSGALDVSGKVSSGTGSSIKIGNVDDILCSLAKSTRTGDMIISGGVNIKYDSANDKAVIAGAGSDQIATLENAAVNLSSGGTLEVSNIGLSDGSKLLVKSEDATATTITNQTDSTAKITGSLSMKYQVAQDTTPAKAIISGAGIDSPATISNAVIDVAAGSKLELSNVVLAETTWLHDDDASTPAPTGKLVLDGVELQMAKGTASTEDGSGVALTLTGGTTAAKNADGSAKTLTGKVYVMDLTQISDFATISGSGNGLTLNFDTYGKGFAELYETLKGYDYVAVKFSDDVVSVDFKTLKVTSKITNGQNDVATSQGYYYNHNGTSGVVVYFDAIALPEPTTSTLGLLALAALCARRRRSRTRAYAEHA